MKILGTAGVAQGLRRRVSARSAVRPPRRGRSATRCPLTQEIGAIQRRADQGDARIVSIGPLMFFSTATGDAWMLDPADQLATRLARDGDPLALYVEETHTNYTLGWQGRYRIDGDAFIYEDSESHRLTAIRGYPLQLLLRAIAQIERQSLRLHRSEKFKYVWLDFLPMACILLFVDTFGFNVWRCVVRRRVIHDTREAGLPTARSHTV